MVVSSRFDGRNIKTEQAYRILSWHILAAFSNVGFKDSPNYNGLFTVTYPGDFFF